MAAVIPKRLEDVNLDYLWRDYRDSALSAELTAAELEAQRTIFLAGAMSILAIAERLAEEPAAARAVLSKLEGEAWVMLQRAACGDVHHLGH